MPFFPWVCCCDWLVTGFNSGYLLLFNSDMMERRHLRLTVHYEGYDCCRRCFEDQFWFIEWLFLLTKTSPHFYRQLACGKFSIKNHSGSWCSFFRRILFFYRRGHATFRFCIVTLLICSLLREMPVKQCIRIMLSLVIHYSFLINWKCQFSLSRIPFYMRYLLIFMFFWIIPSILRTQHHSGLIMHKIPSFGVWFSCSGTSRGACLNVTCVLIGLRPCRLITFSIKYCKLVMLFIVEVLLLIAHDQRQWQSSYELCDFILVIGDQAFVTNSFIHFKIDVKATSHHGYYKHRNRRPKLPCPN